MGMRPMVDVVWTTENQAGDPRWPTPYKPKPNIVHDIVCAALSTGPLGFGDLINGTNASLLLRASRSDGTLLKPASSAVRIDRHYARAGGAEVWLAPTTPATSADPDRCAIANSMPDLSEPSWSQQQPWGWSILATNVNGSAPSGAPIMIDELWPAPALGAKFLVAVVERTGPYPPPRCANGSDASTCLALWDERTPLVVDTAGHGDGSIHNFTLLTAAPVLASGWALLGDLSKFVPVSPQRFVRVAPPLAGSSAPFEVDVIGSPGEEISISLVAPPDDGGVRRVVVLDVFIRSHTATRVECALGRATVCIATPRGEISR
jgi:hypothetical protein